MIDPAVLCTLPLRSTAHVYYFQPNNIEHISSYFLPPVNGPVSLSGSRWRAGCLSGTGLLSAGLNIVRVLVHLQLPIYDSAEAVAPFHDG